MINDFDEEEEAILLGMELEYGQNANVLDIRDYTVRSTSNGQGATLLSYDYEFPGDYNQ